jgi:hypothetical protein
MSLLLCATVLTPRTTRLNVSQAPLRQGQPKSVNFSGKIVSQNGVRFVLRDEGNNVWYHLDDQEKAGKLVGKDVVVTGSFDGLTGTIRVQSIVEATPPQTPPANTAQDPNGKVPTPQLDPRNSADSEILQPAQSESASSPVQEASPPLVLTLPDQAVSSSSSIAISSRRSVPMPSSFNPRTESTKNLQVGRLLKRVDPSYPRDAIQQRIEGTVQLHAVIGEDGKILILEPVSGPPLLVEAAVIAVREWRYGPTLFDGHRIQIQDDLRLVFRLPD